MKHVLHVLSHRPRRLVSVTLLVLLALAVASTPTWAAPPRQGAIHRVYITDVRDSYFVVSWTTDSASTGAVNYGSASPTCTLS